MKISIVVEALTGTFVTDMKRAEKEAARATKEMRKQFEEMGKAIGLAIAGAVTAAAALTKAAINTADQTAKMAQKVGIAVESLSTLAYAARRAGADSEKLRAALTILAKNASDTAGGTGEAIKAFQALGITVTDANGRLKGTEQILLEVADKMAGYEDSAQKTALAVKIFGEAGANLLPFLNQGSAGIAELQARARDLGLEISTNTAKQAEAFNDLIADATDLLNGFANDIAREVLPSLVELSGLFVDSGIKAREASDNAKVLADTMKGIAAAAVTAKEGVEVVTTAIASFIAIVPKYAKFVESLSPTGATANLFQGLFGTQTTSIMERARALSETAEETAGIFGGSFLASVQDLSDAFTALFDPAKQAGEQIAKTGQKAAEAAPRIEGQTKVVRELWVGYDECAAELAVLNEEFEVWKKNNEEATRAAEQQAKAVAQFVDDLRFEVSLIGMSNQEREKAIALRRLEAGATAEQVAEVKRLIEQLQKSDIIKEFQSVWINATEEIGDALTTALFDGAEAGADAIMDVMKQLARDLVRFWLQQQIIIPLQQRMMGGTAQGGGFDMQQIMGMFGGGGSTLGGNTEWGAFGPGSSAWTFGGTGNGNFGSSVFGNSAGRWFGGNSGWAAAGNVLGAVGGIYGVYDTWRNGPGGGQGALSGAVSGAAAGTAIMPGIGTAIGAIIGALAGWFGGEDFDDPRLRVVSSGDIGRNVERGRSAIGSFIVNAEQIQGGRELEEQVVQAIGDFDEAFMRLLETMGSGQEQLGLIQDAAEQWSFDTRGTDFSIEDILQSRFDAFLGTFDEGIQEIVRGADTLEEQMQSLFESVVFPEQLANLLNALAAGDMLAGMTETERQLMVINQQFDQIAEQASALGASLEQLAQIEEYRANAIERLTAAEREAAEAALMRYAELAMSLRPLTGSEYQQTLAQIGQDLNSTIAALEEAARAAGLQGAREEDLGRAHLIAAQRAAQALAALESAGRELATQLYGSDLSDIESQIAQLESSTYSFGEAVQEVARTIDNSINLLLGDLSPLKDRQKIPLALQALQAGQIGQEEALRLGRRVLGSGSDYNDFFAQVLQIGDRRNTGGSVSVGGGTPAVNPQLAALIAERDAILAAQAEAARFGQANDLAQIIADIAGSTGQSFDEVLQNLTGGRADLAQLAEDLRLSGAEAAEEYIRTLQAASYSPADLAEAMRVEFDYLLDGLRDLLNFARNPDAVAFDKPLLGPDEMGEKPGTPETPIYVAPPDEPSPGEREIGERIERMEDRIGRLLEMVALNTGQTAQGATDTATELRGIRGQGVGFAPRSDRRGIPA